MSLYDPVQFVDGGSPTGKSGNDVRPTITDLPFPPTAFTYVEWGGSERLQVDVSIWRDFGVTTTIQQPITLLGGVPKAVADGFFANDDIELVAVQDNEFTLTGHAYRTGDGPFLVANTGGELPGGVEDGRRYWVRVVDANTIQLHTSFASAVSDSSANDGSIVDVTSAGSGTNTVQRLIGVTKRIMWFRVGDLDLTYFNAGLGWIFRFEHLQSIKVYAAAIFTGVTAVPSLAIVINLSRQRLV